MAAYSTSAPFAELLTQSHRITIPAYDATNSNAGTQWSDATDEAGSEQHKHEAKGTRELGRF